MPPTPDYYDLLGIEPDASDADIHAGFMRAASYWHPDRNKSPEALSMMQHVNAARDTLLNPTGKRSYNTSSRVYQNWLKKSSSKGSSSKTGNSSRGNRAGSASNAGSSSGSNRPPRPPATSDHWVSRNIPFIVVIGIVAIGILAIIVTNNRNSGY